MGNVIGKIGKGKKSVMVCVHTDEVGMLVKYIDPKGYIYFDLNGMIDERVLLSTKVDICTDKGIYTGVGGSEESPSDDSGRFEAAYHYFRTLDRCGRRERGRGQKVGNRDR